MSSIRDGVRRLAPMFRTAVGSHIQLTTLVAVGVALRIVVGLTYRPALLFYGDSYEYLYVAKHPYAPLFRPAGYAFFLWPWYHLHAIAAVPWIQHILGIGVGIAVYALLRRLGVGPWLAAAGAAPVLLDAYQLDIEQFLLAEALFEALVVAAVIAVMWSERPSVWAAAGAGALIGVAGLTRTVGLVLLIPLLGYLLARRVGALRVGGAAIAFAVPLVLYGSWVHHERGRFEITGADGFFLYGRVSTFAQCSGMQVPGSELALCDPRPQSKRPNANMYLWGPNAPVDSLPFGKRNSLLLDFSFRVIAHQPAAYAGTVLGDIGHYFAPGRSTGRHDETNQIWNFMRRFPVPGNVYVDAGRALGGSNVFHRGVGASADWLRAYQRFGYTPGPLLGLALVLGVAGAVGRTRREGRPLRAESSFLAACGVLVLLVPALTVMFDYRYLLPTLPLLPASGVLGGSALWDRVRARRDLDSRRANGRPG